MEEKNSKHLTAVADRGVDFQPWPRLAEGKLILTEADPRNKLVDQGRGRAED